MLRDPAFKPGGIGQVAGSAENPGNEAEGEVSPLLHADQVEDWSTKRGHPLRGVSHVWFSVSLCGGWEVVEYKVPNAACVGVMHVPFDSFGQITGRALLPRGNPGCGHA